MEIILSPPLAFLIYIPLVALLTWFGKSMAGPDRSSSIYSSGEKAPTTQAAPGYRPFLLIALFFAIIHLGILVLASGNLSIATVVYLFGLVLALVALMLG